MNDKILKLSQSLFDNEDCRDNKFHLTLNGDNVIQQEGIYESLGDGKGFQHLGWDYPFLNEKGLERIKESLSKIEAKSFNLTLILENGLPAEDDMERTYLPKWYTCSLVFYGGEGKIRIAFDMAKNYASVSYSDFDRHVNKKIIDDEKFDMVIQKLLELKNLIDDNGNRIIDKLEEMKNI